MEGKDRRMLNRRTEKQRNIQHPTSKLDIGHSSVRLLNNKPIPHPFNGNNFKTRIVFQVAGGNVEQRNIEHPTSKLDIGHSSVRLLNNKSISHPLNRNNFKTRIVFQVAGGMSNRETSNIQCPTSKLDIGHSSVRLLNNKPIPHPLNRNNFKTRIVFQVAADFGDVDVEVTAVEE